MPLDVKNHNYFSTSSLGRRHTSSRSRDYSNSSNRSLYGLSNNYGFSAEYSSVGRDNLYTPSSSTSMYLPSRTSFSCPSSSKSSASRPSQSSLTYSTPLTGSLHMSSAMTKRDSIIRSLVRNSPDLSSHHFLSSDTVSMMASSDSIGALGTPNRRPYSSSPIGKLSIRSKTMDLSMPSLMARNTSDLGNYSSYGTTGYGSTPRYTYRPVLMERPSFTNYVPRPREERISATVRAIRRDRPLIKFREKESANPRQVCQLLNAWSIAKPLEEEEENDDFTEIGRVKRDSIRSNDSGIGSFRSSFFRNSRRKSGESVADLDQIIDECDTEDDDKCAFIPKEIQKTSIDEGVQLENVELIQSPCSTISICEEKTLDFCKENITGTLAKTTELSLQENAQSDFTNKRRVRINMDKPVVSFVVKDKPAHEECNSSGLGAIEKLSNDANEQNVKPKLTFDDKKMSSPYISHSGSSDEIHPELVNVNREDQNVYMRVENVISNSSKTHHTTIIPLEIIENNSINTITNMKAENLSHKISDMDILLEQISCKTKFQEDVVQDLIVKDTELVHPVISTEKETVNVLNDADPLKSAKKQNPPLNCPTLQDTSLEKQPEIKEVKKKKIKKYEKGDKKPKLKLDRKKDEHTLLTTVAHSASLAKSEAEDMLSQPMSLQCLEQDSEKCDIVDQTSAIKQNGAVQMNIIKNKDACNVTQLCDTNTDKQKYYVETPSFNTCNTKPLKLTDLQKASDDDFLTAATNERGFPISLSDSFSQVKQNKCCGDDAVKKLSSKTNKILIAVKNPASIESSEQHSCQQTTLDQAECISDRESKNKENSQHPKNELPSNGKDEPNPCMKEALSECTYVTCNNSEISKQRLHEDALSETFSGDSKFVEQNACHSHEINQFQKLREISNNSDNIEIEKERNSIDVLKPSKDMHIGEKLSENNGGKISLKKQLNMTDVKYNSSEGDKAFIMSKTTSKEHRKSLSRSENITIKNTKNVEEFQAISQILDLTSNQPHVQELKRTNEFNQMPAVASKLVGVLEGKRKDVRNVTQIQKCPSADFKVELNEARKNTTLNKIQKSSTAKAELCFENNINTPKKEKGVIFFENTLKANLMPDVIDKTKHLKVKKSTTIDFGSSNETKVVFENKDPDHKNKLKKSSTTDCNGILKSRLVQRESTSLVVEENKDNKLNNELKIDDKFVVDTKQPIAVLSKEGKKDLSEFHKPDTDKASLEGFNPTGKVNIRKSEEKSSSAPLWRTTCKTENKEQSKISSETPPLTVEIEMEVEVIQKLTTTESSQNIQQNIFDLNSHENNVKADEQLPQNETPEGSKVAQQKPSKQSKELRISNEKIKDNTIVLSNIPSESEVKEETYSSEGKCQSTVTQHHIISPDTQRSDDSSILKCCSESANKNTVGHFEPSDLKSDKTITSEKTSSTELTDKTSIIPSVVSQKPDESIEKKAKIKKEKKVKVEGEKPKKKKKKNDVLTEKSKALIPHETNDISTSAIQQLENNIEASTVSAEKSSTEITNNFDKSRELTLSTQTQIKQPSFDGVVSSYEPSDIEVSTVSHIQNNSEAHIIGYIPNKPHEVAAVEGLGTASSSTTEPQNDVACENELSRIPTEVHSEPTPLTNTLQPSDYSIEDFHLLKVLGRGSYGKVMLAELKTRNEYFAIKCLKKDVVLEDNDVECTMIEKEVLAMGSNHPYLCTLFCTFQTESHLFFVMEYLSGGDLMFHIQQSGRFDQDRARFYAAEIVCALKFLHKNGIIYRDAKLDNICIDADGHIRLVDFGFCKLRIYRKECLPRNLCGTPDYMAPEIIKGYHYNQSVDWWSFGVLLYEMLIGQSPFSGADEEELFWSVCNEEAYYPRFITKEAKQLLALLLEKDAIKRLGMPGCNAGDICTQPFFRSINWTKVDQKELEPPFKPKLKSEIDVSNFDSDFTMEKAALTPIDNALLTSMDQSLFEGFTYENKTFLASGVK